MLREAMQTMIAACPLSVRFETLPNPAVIHLSRPLWDDGTNYDIPTYLRRARSRRRRPACPVPAPSPPSAGAVAG